MQVRSTWLIMLVLMSCGWGGVARAQEAEASATTGTRFWTSHAGSEIEAEFVAIEDGFVILRATNGAEMRIEPRNLSAADQALLATLAPPPAPEPPPEPAKAAARRDDRARVENAEPPDSREVFLTPGPQHFDAKELGALLQTHDFPDYTALVTARGWILIYVKDEGAYRTGPIRLYNEVQYLDPERRQQRGRPVTGAAAPPMLTPNSAHLKLTHRDGVYSELIALFQADQVQIGFHISDPKDLAIPSSARRIRVRMPAIVHWDADQRKFISPDFPAGVDLAQVPKHLTGYELILRGAKTLRFPYARQTRSLPGDNKRVEIAGRVFTTKALAFEGRGQKTAINAYIYRDKTPADGYSLFFLKERPENPADNRNEQFLITIR